MFAAPSAPEQLHIVADIAKLGWKERLLKYEQLVKDLPERTLDELLEVEVCFLEMLKEKNLNVAAKVIELVRAYARLQPITKCAVDQLLVALFNFSGVDALPLETLVLELYARNDRRALLESLGQCCRSKNHRKSLKGYRTLRLLVEEYGVEQLLWLECSLEDVRAVLQSHSPELISQGKQLMKALYCRMGSKAIQLAKQSGCSFLQQLQEFAARHQQVLPFQDFPEGVLHKRFDFFGKYCLQSGLQHLKIKSLNDCLRQMHEDSERDSFVEGDYQPLLEMLVGCAKRSNRTSNKLIFGIVSNLFQKVDLRKYSQQLLDVLFELVGSEQLRKKLECCSLLRIITHSGYLQKLVGLTTQTDYHKAIVLLELLKDTFTESQLQDIKNAFAQVKLNIVYRLQLEALFTD